MELAVYDMKIEKYSEYKDSGLKWIGKIPKHWSVKKLGNLLNPVSIKNQPDLPLLSITREKGVILRDLDNEEENHNFIPDDLSNYKVIRKGQFGMNKMKAWQGSYGISEYDGIVSPAYYIFDLDSDIVGKFFHAAIRSRLYVSFFGAASDGVRIGQWDLSKPRMREIPFLIPPIEEQTAIAQFLDRKTTQIDKAIAQKEKLIELLKERRQILIHEVVTRGLPAEAPANAGLIPKVKLKPSGVEWIGEIPEHWEVKKVKNIFRLIVEPAPIKNDFELLSIYTDIGVKPRKELEERGNRASTTDGYWLVKKGDFIVNKLLAWMGAIGLSNYDGVTSPAYDILRPTVEISGLYFHELFRTAACSSELKKHSRGIMDMRLRLYFDKFGDVRVPFPTIDEQHQIVTAIENLSIKIYKAILLKEQEIEKLKEYKATLINSAVTGKIKVC